jgi:hypothetical protein
LGEARGPGLVDKERRVAHAERHEDALVQELIETLAGDLLDEVAEHVGRHRVVPRRAGRELERDACQRIDESLQPVVALEGVDLERAVRSVDVGAVLEAVGQPRGVAQQVDDAHRRVGRLRQPAGRRAGQATAAADIHAQVAPRRNEPVHRIVERHLAFLHQHHEGDAGDRLGHRIDAHDRVVPHRAPGLEVGVAEQRLVHDPAVARDQQLRTRQLAGADVALGKEAVDARKALAAHADGFGGGAHGTALRAARSGMSAWERPGALMTPSPSGTPARRASGPGSTPTPAHAGRVCRSQ